MYCQDAAWWGRAHCDGCCLAIRFPGSIPASMMTAFLTGCHCKNCSTSQTSMHIGNCTLQVCQCSSLHALCMPPSATVPSRQLPHLFWTVCRRQYEHRHHCQFSAVDWRSSFLLGLSAVLTKECWHCTNYCRTPVVTVMCSRSLRTLCHVKVNLYVIIIIIIIYCHCDNSEQWTPQFNVSSDEPDHHVF